MAGAFAIRGVLEGFYGRPWAWAEREAMIEFMGRQGLNLYMYAPKNDPIHRNRWREPYLPEEIRRFGKLVQMARERQIEFVFGLSPLQFHYSDAADLEMVWEKLLPLFQVGCRSFSILLDDMPDKFHHPDDGERFAGIAAAQVWLNNQVLQRLRALGDPTVKLYFCPTEYCGNPDTPYLHALGAGLDPAIDVFWTGGEVCSQFLKTADARAIRAVLRRSVVYWDNYPVNDLAMQHDPHLLPLKGRDPDLHTACLGIVANGGPQPEANKIAFHCYAQYMADPRGYEPESAWQKALLAVTGDPVDAAAVALLADLARRSVLERGRSLDNFLLPHLRWYWELWGGVPAAAGPDLPDLAAQAPPPDEPAGLPANHERALDGMDELFGRLWAAAERLLGGLMRNRQLEAELRPWANKLMGWALVARQAVWVLRRAYHDPHDPHLPELREEVLDRLLITRENFAWVGGDMIDQFARRCLWAAEALKGEAEHDA